MKHLLATALLGLVAACGPVTADSNAATATDQPAATATSTTALSVTRAGNPDGPDLVLVPGLASGPDVWADVVTAFPNADIHLVHAAGFAGRAPLGTTEGLTDRMAEELAVLVADLDDPVLVGHSLGGFVSLKAGSMDPDAVKRIVVVDSLPFLAALFLPGQSPEQAAQSATAMAAQMAAMPRAAFDAQQEAMIARQSRNTAAHPRIAASAKASDQATVASAMGDLLAADLRDGLSELKTPLTVLMPYDPAMGVPEPVLRQTYADQYAAAPDVELVTVPDSFHFIMDDQPDALHDAIRAALAE